MERKSYRARTVVLLGVKRSESLAKKDGVLKYIDGKEYVSSLKRKGSLQLDAGRGNKKKQKTRYQKKPIQIANFLRSFSITLEKEN